MTSVPTRRELLAWFVAFALIITFAVSWTSDQAAGSDDGRGAVAEEGTGPTPLPEAPPAGTPLTVYVATGLNFPDALGAAGAAGVALGPVLLVQTNSVPGETLAELNRLQPNRIVIVGGTAVISDTVKTQLEGLSFGPTVDRIAGANRYDTAAQLSADTHWTRGFYPRPAGIAAEDAIAGDNTLQTVLTFDHTTVIPGYYLLWGFAEMFGGADNSIVCEIWVDPPGADPAARVTGARSIVEHDGTGSSEEDCSPMSFLNAPTPGTYTISLRVDADTDITIVSRSLLAQWGAWYPGS